MDRQQKIDILQKELSRNDLDMGCEVYSKAYHKRMTIAYVFTAGGRKYGRMLGESNKDTLYIEYLGYHGDISENDISKVYGHPVILSDVLVWLGTIDYNWILNSNYILIRDNKKECNDTNIIEIRRDLTKPYLSEQSDEVINGLYEVFLLTKKD